MSAVTFHYFDIYGRAEPARMILSYYGTRFTDHRVAMQEWGPLKTSGFAEFGQLPRLDIDGLEMVESHSIFRYLCQKNGAYPSDEAEIYLVESISDLRDDIVGSLLPLFFKNLQDEVNNWYRDTMPKMLRMIEKRLLDNDREGRFFVGRRVSMADFLLFEFGYDSFCRNGLKERFEGVLRDNAPTFHRFVQYFKDSNENLRNYLANRPEKPL